MRKGRPATLTSSLLARKGEAEPSRLADGSVPKDVMALQQELVARVAAGIAPPDESQTPFDMAPRMPGQAAPKLPIDAVYVGFAASLDYESQTGAASVPDEAEEPVEADEPLALEPAPAASTQEEPEAEDEPAPALQAAAEDEEEEEEELAVAAEAFVGPEAPAHAEPPPAEALAGEDEPDAEILHEDEDETAAEGEEPSGPVTLADWTERVRLLEKHPLDERLPVPVERKRATMLPLALSIVAITALAGLAVWRFASEGEVFAPASHDVASTAPAPVAPSAEIPVPPPEASDSVAASAPPADALPTLGPIERTGTPSASAAPKPAGTPAPKPAPSAAPAAMAAPKPAPAAEGAYAIQLVSTVSQATAEQAWTALSKRFAAMTGSHTHDIVRADLGAKGVRYRVRLTGFASLASARDACKALEAKGQGCLILNH
jgi:hypothetical protein